MQAANRLVESIGEDRYPTQGQWGEQEAERRIKGYDSATELLRAILMIGSYWSQEEHDELWGKCLAKVANQPRPGGGVNVWIGLRWYPLILLAYSAGMGAISAGNYRTFKKLIQTKVDYEDKGRVPLIHALTAAPGAMQSKSTFNVALYKGREQQKVPMHEHLLDLLAFEVPRVLLLEAPFEPLFDRFEVLLALCQADYLSEVGGGARGVLGRFAYKYDPGWKEKRDPFRELIREFEKQGDNWPPLKAGLFNGTRAYFRELVPEFQKWLHGSNLWA